MPSFGVVSLLVGGVEGHLARAQGNNQTHDVVRVLKCRVFLPHGEQAGEGLLFDFVHGIRFLSPSGG